MIFVFCVLSSRDPRLEAESGQTETSHLRPGPGERREAIHCDHLEDTAEDGGHRPRLMLAILSLSRSIVE